MAKFISTIKATITRIIFSAHSFIAVWQVTQNKRNPIYWTLCGPIGLLFIEGVFTLAIKKNQEWRWFCPSVFLYLGSVVPAIWLLEMEKMDQRVASFGGKTVTEPPEHRVNLPTAALGVNIPNIEVDIDLKTWTTLIEQFLMLILIIGRWLLPKGDLTRDQLSQLLLVYIGTAADIIEFFDSYKEDAIARESLLVYLTLGIWSWSLLQFTIVLSATRSRRPRGGGSSNENESNDCCGNCCCGIDVWGIALNVLLQDAPFLAFRLLIIVHYKIINYMNVFFTCKNTLVILLQLYRLYVVNSEHWKSKKELKKSAIKNYHKNKKGGARKKCYYEDDYSDRTKDIYIISNEKYDQKRIKRSKNDSEDDDFVRKSKIKKEKKKKRNRKDTGYDTQSPQNKKKEKKLKKKPLPVSSEDSDSSNGEIDKKKKRTKQKDELKSRHTEKRKTHKDIQSDAATEESDTSESSSDNKLEIINEKKSKKRKKSSSSSSSSERS